MKSLLPAIASRTQCSSSFCCLPAIGFAFRRGGRVSLRRGGRVAPPVYKLAEYLIQNSMLDVRPARNAFVQILCSAYNVDVSAAIIILTLSTLHGRRVLDVHSLLAFTYSYLLLPNILSSIRNRLIKSRYNVRAPMIAPFLTSPASRPAGCVRAIFFSFWVSYAVKPTKTKTPI